MRAIRRLGIALLSLIVFLGLLEGAARLFGVRPRERVTPVFSWVERGELYTMTPGRSWILPGKRDLVRVNALGLRGPEIGPKPPGMQRILLLGDSVAFGYEVPEKHAIPARLEALLRSRGLPVEVVSAAIPGWCARQQRLFLETQGPELDPDVVLATVVLNDIPELQLGEAELNAALESANVLTWLTERSAFAAGARQVLARASDPFETVTHARQLVTEADTPAVRSAMRLELEELAALAGVARAQEVPFALLLMPFRFQLEDRDADGPQREIAAFAKTDGIVTFDLLSTLRRWRARGVFADQVHLTAFGNSVVAEAVAEWLVRRRLVGATKRAPRSSPGTA